MGPKVLALLSGVLFMLATKESGQREPGKAVEAAWVKKELPPAGKEWQRPVEASEVDSNEVDNSDGSKANNNGNE